MKRRNFLASLLALPFVAKVVEPLKPFATRKMVLEEVCPHCGESGGKPVNFHPWNDPFMEPERACTLCQNWIDLDNKVGLHPPFGRAVTVRAGGRPGAQ